MAELMIPAGAATAHFAPSFSDLLGAIEAIDRASCKALGYIVAVGDELVDGRDGQPMIWRADKGTRRSA